MLRNFRTLLVRYRVSSLLNIFGMGVAFAAVWLIAVQVGYDLSYNRRVPHAGRIYRLERPSWYEEGRRSMVWNRTLPHELCGEIPEIERCGSIILGGGQQEFSIRRNHTIDNFRLHLSKGEPEGFGVFGFEMAAGSLDDLKSTDDLLLAASAAERLGLEIGDRLHFGRGAENPRIFTVAALYRDFEGPGAFDGLDGFVLLPSRFEERNNHWAQAFYLRLTEGADAAQVEAKMRSRLHASLIEDGCSPEEAEQQMKLIRPTLDPFTELYFAEEVEGHDVARGNRTTTRTLAAIAVLILAVAFINFVNFFFALLPVRMRAVHICRIFGASQARLRLELLGEMTALVFAALVVAAGLLLLFADTPMVDLLSAPVSLRGNGRITLALAGSAVAVGLLASLFSFRFLAGFRSAQALRGAFQASAAGRWLRYALVGIQYAIAIVLVSATLFIWRQHAFMMDYDMGFDREQLYGVAVPQSALPDFERYEALAGLLKRNPEVTGIGAAEDNFVAVQRSGWGYTDAETGRMNLFTTYRVTADFLDFMGIEIVGGRGFTAADERSDDNIFIINETAARQFRLAADAQLPRNTGAPTFVVGICRDFHFMPMQYGLEPFAFIVGKRSELPPNYLYIRMAAGVPPREARDYIRETILGFDASIEPERIEPRFIDEELEETYVREQRLGRLVLLFSLLVILIAMMGVFGLVLFETKYRRREIGIRRVNGATVGEILCMFNRKFLWIVALCSIVAVPIARLIVGRWLSAFAYRTPIVWWVFTLAILLVALLTVATVTARSWAAANENPSEVVRGN